MEKETNNFQAEVKPDFSVIIPTYNEAGKEKEMEEHLASIEKYFEKIGKSYEVLIVLDGPTDETPELVKEKAEKFKNIKIIDRKENKGKGFTVRQGMIAASGKIRLFTDMDGATPIAMLDRFIPEFEKGADLVIGSRDLAESEVKVHQPKWKEFLGDAGNIMIQAIGGLWGIKDTQCGFKAFTEKSTEDIIPRATVDRWGLDFEILAVAKKLDYKIVEVPVEWQDKGQSLVGGIFSGYISTLRDLFKVRWNLIKGTYKLNQQINKKQKI